MVNTHTTQLPGPVTHNPTARLSSFGLGAWGYEVGIPIGTPYKGARIKLDSLELGSETAPL